MLGGSFDGRSCTAVSSGKAAEDRDCLESDFGVRVVFKDSGDPRRHLSDAQVVGPALLTCKTVQCEVPHGSHRIVKCLEKDRGGLVGCVVVEEAQAASPNPWVLMFNGCELHLADRNPGSEALPGATRGILPTAKKAFDSCTGFREQHRIKCTELARTCVTARGC